MGTEPLERKLAAILYADVAGYSRLTGEDERAPGMEPKLKAGQATGLTPWSRIR